MEYMEKLQDFEGFTRIDLASIKTLQVLCVYDCYQRLSGCRAVVRDQHLSVYAPHICVWSVWTSRLQIEKRFRRALRYKMKALLNTVPATLIHLQYRRETMTTQRVCSVFVSISLNCEWWWWWWKSFTLLLPYSDVRPLWSEGVVNRTRASIWFCVWTACCHRNSMTTYHAPAKRPSSDKRETTSYCSSLSERYMPSD
jgi:hypothetical protein